MIRKRKTYSNKLRHACAVAVAQCWLNSYPELTWALHSEVLQSKGYGSIEKGKCRTPVRLLFKAIATDINAVLLQRAKIAPLDKLIRLTLWIKRKNFLRVYNKDEISLLLIALWSHIRAEGTLDGFAYIQFAPPTPFLKMV